MKILNVIDPKFSTDYWCPTLGGHCRGEMCMAWTKERVEVHSPHQFNSRFLHPPEFKLTGMGYCGMAK